MQQDPQHLPTPSFGTVQSFIVLAVNGLALSVEVFLHDFRSFGVRYVGLQGIVPVIFVPVLVSFFLPERGPISPEHDPTLLLCLLGIYLLLIAFARLSAFRRAATGDSTHSYYSGAPWIMGRNCRIPEVTLKAYLEPLLVAGLAFLLLDYNEPLAIYLLIAVSCLFAMNLQATMSMRGRVMDMNDAVAEQEIVAEQFRNMRHDNF